MRWHRFANDALAQSCYLVADGGEALVVDPLRDVDDVVAFAAAHGLRIVHAVATHVHADFVAGLHELAAATGARIAMGERFAGGFSCAKLGDGDVVRIGGTAVEVLATPGHTVESVCLRVSPHDAIGPERLLTGDTLFVGEVGRPDLAQGDGMAPDAMARALFASLHERLAALPDATEVWPAHGAGSACGASIAGGVWTTLGAERAGNWALRERDPERFAARLLGSLRPPPRHFAAVARLNRNGPPLLAARPSLREVSIATARAARAAGACLLDVRSTAEHGAGHWPDACHVGLAGGEFEPWAGELLPPGVEVVIHAADAAMAHTAALRLARVGEHRLLGFVRGLPEDAERLPQIEALDLLAPVGGVPWQVVDVRRPAEFAAGHVAGARSCELGAEPPLAALAAFARSRPTALVCDGGYRSSAAARALRTAGFTALHNVRDGMRGWRQNHLPLVSGELPTATS
jgi:hydroxyacylglutathione hydrolase